MKKYIKKPVVIKAVQFDGLNPTEIKDFVGENCEVEIYDNEVTPPIARIIIHTLEGDMEVSNGDYVIKGIKGEFYPCKPDIFEQTYSALEPSCLEKKGKCQTEYLRKDVVIDEIKLAFGKVSMNPFDCSEAFEELLKKIDYETH